MPTIHHGDCIETMKAMPPESIDAIVTDPPYGLGFMGKKWDGLPPSLEWAEACYRVLKPGGHIAAFGGTRTWHRLAVAIEDAGFEMRDSLAWLYGSGFPKSMNVGKAIDKAAGAERKVIGQSATVTPRSGKSSSGFAPLRNIRWGDVHYSWEDAPSEARAYFEAQGATRGQIAAPATPEAEQWDGWGTALKPAFEPIVLARKPLAEKTVARNVLAHGTGAINVDACRIESGENLLRKATAGAGGSFLLDGFSTVDELRASADVGGKTPTGRDARAALARYEATQGKTFGSTSGRWPANVLLDEHAAAWVDEQSGHLPAGSRPAKRSPDAARTAYGAFAGQDGLEATRLDSGGASRFFYTAKAPKSERPNVDGVQHPTVKPLAIMRWLIRLVTPPGGVVLDPFAGSGTTIEAALIEGFNPVGIEMEADYLPLIQHRIDRQAGTLTA